MPHLFIQGIDNQSYLAWLTAPPPPLHSMNKMAATSQTTFSNVFSRIKMLIIFIQTSLRFVPKDPIDHVSIGSVNDLSPKRWQAITWTNADPFYGRIYAALGGDALNYIQWKNKGLRPSSVKVVIAIKTIRSVIGCVVGKYSLLFRASLI